MTNVDVLVIGGGPAGQKAAVEAAKAGRSTLLVEDEAAPGGACVRLGTILSKTLRETAVAFEAFRRRTEGVVDVRVHARSFSEVGAMFRCTLPGLPAPVRG